jgi:predicted dehydrogenase
VDLDEARAESLREMQPGARATADYREALSDAQVDAVTVCLPHNLHAPVSVEAAEAGKHVLCEKPMAASLEEADRMIAAAERAGVVLMIAENVRFNPLFHRIRELLQDGVIGQPALIHMTRQAYLTRSFLDDRPWFLDSQAAAGGIMMAGGIHDFETMRMLIGEVESVQALRARQRFRQMEGDDTSVAMVRFRGGAVGVLIESFVMKSLTTAAGLEVHTLRIDGDLGSLSVRDGRTIRLFSERDDFLPGGALAQHEIHVPPADTFALEIEHFMQSIRSGEEPITSGRSQRRPLEIVLAAYESMRLGQRVTLFSNKTPGPTSPG